MAMQIYPKTIAGHTYYYAQRSYREKVLPGAPGKTKGSGKSRVRSGTVYLGSAESIVAALSKTREPLEVRHREFGMVATAYQTAVELGLVDVLKQHVRGERFGAPRWLYFLLPMLHRLSCGTSKARMGDWALGTVLPTLLGFDAKRLNSQTFWYGTDDVISEKALKERRKEHPDLDGALFVGLDDATFRAMEQAVVRELQRQYPLDGNVLLYDTTNFLTYIEQPVRSRLARTGHNKDCHHHLRGEGDFKLLKDPDIIRWRPCRHWTDTKIRAFGFCCVMALLLLRVMELKAARAGLRMSPAVLKQELDDLREITIVYDPCNADVHISARSSVQQQLWDLFKLSSVEIFLTGQHTAPPPQP